MKYLCLVICLIGLLMSLRKEKRIYNPSTLFYGLWLIIISFNILGLYGLNQASEQTYIFVFVGLGGFMTGTIVKRFFVIGKYKKRTKYDIHNHSNTVIFNMPIIKILFIASIILISIDSIIALRYLLAGNSYAAIRMWLSETYENSTNPIDARKTYLEQVFRVVVIEPFQTAVIPLGVVDFVFNENKNKLFPFSLVLIILGIFSTGGARLAIVYFILTMAFGFQIKGIKLKAFSRRITIKDLIPKIFIIVSIIGILSLTLIRSYSGIVREVYYYLSLCIPLLDYWTPTIIESGHTWGVLSLFGLLRIPFIILEKIFNGAPAVFDTAKDYILQANTFHVVGERSGNSFVTPFYYLYLDFGYIGIFFGMFILGAILETYYKRIKVKANIKDYYIFLLLLQVTMTTFIRWQFIGTSFCMAFMMVFVLFKKNTNKKQVN